ncbi:MAG: transposase [Thermoleophilaceae bacterium]
MGRPTRRTFTPQQKLEIVMALQRGEKQLTALAREHGVDHTTIYRWRDQVQAAALDALSLCRGRLRAGP